MLLKFVRMHIFMQIASDCSIVTSIIVLVAGFSTTTSSSSTSTTTFKVVVLVQGDLVIVND